MKVNTTKRVPITNLKNLERVRTCPMLLSVSIKSIINEESPGLSFATKFLPHKGYAFTHYFFQGELN